jgi:glycosyltransferase involved in cell wall biosynthesis
VPCWSHLDVRIAMISTPFVPVPPPGYGGTELIVAELVQGLVAAGNEVTLFATGDSQTSAELRALFAAAEWPPHPTLELDHAAWAVAEILADPRPFDVVHAHVASALPFSRFVDVPMVYTIHHDRHDKLARMYRRHRAQYVAISARQRELCPEVQQATVIHHGLSPERYPAGTGAGGYAAFLGRFAAEKGLHLALDVARAAGLPLKLAGRPHWCDQEYFEAECVPRLRTTKVEVVGEVGGGDKTHILGEAMALLFPVCWEEPFGLVMIEAMLCGTPVVGLGRGAVPEVVESGVTGYVCANADEMAYWMRQIAAHGFDRRRCRARALERWSASRMVREHLAMYQRLHRWEPVDARSAAPGA